MAFLGRGLYGLGVSARVGIGRGVDGLVLLGLGVGFGALGFFFALIIIRPVAGSVWTSTQTLIEQLSAASAGVENRPLNKTVLIRSRFIPRRYEQLRE